MSEVAELQMQLTTHISTTKGWNAELVWLVDLLQMVYPYKMVTRQLQVERRTGKVSRQKTDVLPLCHATITGDGISHHYREKQRVLRNSRPSYRECWHAGYQAVKGAGC